MRSERVCDSGCVVGCEYVSMLVCVGGWVRKGGCVSGYSRIAHLCCPILSALPGRLRVSRSPGDECVRKNRDNSQQQWTGEWVDIYD